MPAYSYWHRYFGNVCSHLAAFAGAMDPHNASLYQQKICDALGRHPSIPPPPPSGTLLCRKYLQEHFVVWRETSALKELWEYGVKFAQFPLVLL